jgi:hypothetical protein
MKKSDNDDMTAINGTTQLGAYNSADQPSADSQGATPVSNDDGGKSAVSNADHTSVSGQDAKLYGNTRQEMKKSSVISIMRNGFKKPKSTAEKLRDQPQGIGGRVIMSGPAVPPKAPIKQPPMKLNPAMRLVKALRPTHVAGVEIPHELHQHYHAGNVIPHDHPLREKAAGFVTQVWRKNPAEGKRMSSKLLGIGEEGKIHPNARPGYATIKADMQMSRNPFKRKSVKKLEPGGTHSNEAPVGMPSQESGQAVQSAISGGLPNKTGLANVAQEFGHLFGKAEEDAKAASAGPVEAPDKPYNPKLERPTQRARVQDVKSKLTAEPSKVKLSISTSNSKLAKDHIGSFNLVPIETCPGAGSCAKYCYADTGSFLRFAVTKNGGTMPPRVANWLASQKDDFVPKMIALIDKHKKAKGAKHIQALRIHDSGDFYAPQYIDKWTEIAKAHPDLKFYAYTKSHHPKLRERLNEFEKLPNVNIVQSFGSKYDHLIDPSKPHAVVFPDEDSMKKAGYASAMDTDLTASDKNNKKIGLYIHGTHEAWYPGLEEHIKANPAIYKEIMDALKHGTDVKKSESWKLRKLMKRNT